MIDAAARLSRENRALFSPCDSTRCALDESIPLASTIARSFIRQLASRLFILFSRGEKEYKAVPRSVGEAVGRAWSAAVYAKPPRLTSPRIASPRLASPRLASPRLTSPHLTSPHLTSPRLTSPHLTSPHLTAPRLSACLPACLPACLLACLPCLPAWLPSLLVCVFARNVGISLRVLDATRLRGSPNGRENWKEGNARNVTKLRRGSDKEERSASGSKARTRYAAKSVDERDAGPRRQAAPNRSLRLPRLTAPVLSTRGDRERRR